MVTSWQLTLNEIAAVMVWSNVDKKITVFTILSGMRKRHFPS